MECMLLPVYIQFKNGFLPLSLTHYQQSRHVHSSQCSFFIQFMGTGNAETNLSITWESGWRLLEWESCFVQPRMMCIYLEVNPTEFSGAYSQGSVHRTAALEVLLKTCPAWCGKRNGCCYEAKNDCGKGSAFTIVLQSILPYCFQCSCSETPNFRVIYMVWT